MENDKCTVHLQLAWQWNFVHVAVILGNSSRLEGEGTSQQKNTSLISRHPDLEPCSSFSLVGPVSSLYLQCWGFSSYSFSCHLRPHSLVSGELIKKGRLRWWDAQLKKHRWSWHENRRAGHAFIFGDHVGLCMPENNSGIPPHLRSTTSPVILTWATRKQTTVFNVTCRVWARPGTSQAWGPHLYSHRAYFLVNGGTSYGKKMGGSRISKMREKNKERGTAKIHKRIKGKLHCFERYISMTFPRSLRKVSLKHAYTLSPHPHS